MKNDTSNREENNFYAENLNINNTLFYTIKNAESAYVKYFNDITNFSVNNVLYEVFQSIEEFDKENNDILNYETCISNYEEIIYQTNVNIENDNNFSYNDKNICNYKELIFDLYLTIKNSIIPKRLLIILNKYKDNKIFIIIIILLFLIFSFCKDIIYDMIKNTLKNLIVVRSSEDIKTTIINQTINNIIVINDNKPYYYYIETKDKNGNIINGYVSKRKYNKLKSNKTVQK